MYCINSRLITEVLEQHKKKQVDILRVSTQLSLKLEVVDFLMVYFQYLIINLVFYTNVFVIMPTQSTWLALSIALKSQVIINNYSLK